MSLDPCTYRCIICVYMGVSKNSGTPKWMVYFMENPINMDELGVPLFLETPIRNIYTHRI